MKLICFIFIVLLSIKGYSQHLIIPNGSFEDTVINGQIPGVRVSGNISASVIELDSFGGEYIFPFHNWKMLKIWPTDTGFTLGEVSLPFYDCSNEIFEFRFRNIIYFKDSINERLKLKFEGFTQGNVAQEYIADIPAGNTVDRWRPYRWRIFSSDQILDKHDSCRMSILFDTLRPMSKESFVLIDYMILYDLRVGNDENSEGHFKIYPNPVKDFCAIESENIFMVEVLSLLGMVIKEFNLSDGISILDFRDLKPGTYFLRFASSKGSIYNSRVIKH